MFALQLVFTAVSVLPALVYFFAQHHISFFPFKNVFTFSFFVTFFANPPRAVRDAPRGRVPAGAQFLPLADAGHGGKICPEKEGRIK